LAWKARPNVTLDPESETSEIPYALSFEPADLYLGTILFVAYSRDGVDGIATFNTSPYLKQFGNFFISRNGQWIPNPDPPANRDYLYFGATFRFELLQPPVDLPFRITTISSRTNGTVSLQWESVTNQLYQVKRSFEPSRSNHTVLVSNVLATPPVNSFTDATATNGTSFYWIEVQQ